MKKTLVFHCPLQARLAFGTAEQEILQDGVSALLELLRRSVKIDSAFVQVSNAIGDLHRALHVVRDNNARYLKSLLQSTDEMINAVRYHGV